MPTMSTFFIVVILLFFMVTSQSVGVITPFLKQFHNAKQLAHYAIQ